MPGIIERARIAWRVFNQGYPAPAYRKSSPLAWPSWRAGQPQWQIYDFTSYVNEGFNLNSLIYSAIMFKVRSLSQSPLRAYTGDVDNPVPAKATHPLAQLVARPNKFQSWMALQNANTCYLNIAGNVFIALDRPNLKVLPTAMYSLRPDRTFIVPDRKGGLQGYYYIPEGASVNDGTVILPENMIHIKLPNPGDPLEGLGYGLSPISALARSADVDNNITKFIKLFFERGAIVPIVLKFNHPLTTDQIAYVKERWHEQYGSYKNWAEVGVLDSDAEMQRAGLTFDEMGFDALDERNESRILGPFGVPPILIGTRMGLLRSTYSNYGEARRACWEDTLIPELMWYENALQPYLQDGDAFVAFDTSKVPALQKDVPVLATAAKSLWDMGVSADVAFQTVGLAVERVPGVTDKHFVPLGVIEIGAPRPAPALPGAAPAQPAGEQPPPDTSSEGAPSPNVTDEEQQAKAQPGPAQIKGLSVEQKDRLWLKADRRATSWESKFADRAAAQFEADRRELLALVSDAKAQAKAAKATVAWQDYLLKADAYLDMAGDNWREAFVPLLEALIAEHGADLNATFGMSFDVRNLFAEKWWREYQLKFAQDILFTTKADVHQIVAQAVKEGWSIPQMQKQLGLTFDRYIDPAFTLDGRKLTDEEIQWFTDRQPAYRTENIARTETMRAENAGSNALYQDWGAPAHEWWSTHDDRTRDIHRIGAAWGQPALIVPIGQPFEVGGEKLMYPGDPSGDPGNTCQCRCTDLPAGIGEGA
jgi:HK97 family phage portal protein